MLHVNLRALSPGDAPFGTSQPDEDTHINPTFVAVHSKADAYPYWAGDGGRYCRIIREVTSFRRAAMNEFG